MNHRSRWNTLILAVLLMGMAGARSFASDESQTPKSRRFRFYYSATVNGLQPGDVARIWIPIATSSDEQDVELVSVGETGAANEETETMDDNRVHYFEATANDQGEMPIDLEYLVERRELLTGQAAPVDAGEAAKHLDSSSLVPVDGSVIKRLFGDAMPEGSAHQRAQRIYQAIDDLMRYDKPEGKPWGRGDALWACDAKYGNCTDLHSIFIGACRDLKIPAEFEIGFSVPENVGTGEVPGYHCWAKYFNQRRWEGVDISEADKHPELKSYYFGNLTADRVTFSKGRDLVLEPAPQAGAVNFLVYPYVEVDGKPHTKLLKRFRYQDVP